MFDELIRSLVLVRPLVALIVCVLVYLIFHRLSYVLLTLTISAVAVIWTLGSSVFRCRTLVPQIAIEGTSRGRFA